MTSDHQPPLPDPDAAIRKVTWVGAMVNLILAIMKVITGMLWHSAALVADGIHSLSDLISDAIVLIAARHGRQPADEDHPYGHARYETAAIVVLGAMLAAVAIGIAVNAGTRILERTNLEIPGIPAIIIATLALASKEWLYHYTMVTARRIKSSLLEANAWHHRSDAISSFVVLIGIAGAMIGLPILDAIAAIIVAVMIAHIAWELMSNSVRELVDTAVDEKTRQSITRLINHTDGVVNLHMLRTRRMGGNILIDAHLQVQPRLSVSEGHQIAETVGHQLKSRIEGVHDVTIHIDPEDDERIAPNHHLPLRTKLLQKLAVDWSRIPQSTEIKEINLHYLDGKVEVALLLPLPAGGDREARKIQRSFREVADTHQDVSIIRVLFS